MLQHPSATAAPGLPVYRWLTVLALLLIAAGCLAGILVPAGLQWDFANFYDAGRLVATGHADSLLVRDKSGIEGFTPLGNLDFWGTPLSAWLYVPLARLQPEAALVAFKVENVLAYGVALLLLFVHLKEYFPRSAHWRLAAMFTVMALFYQPFWTVFRVGGQTTATVLLLLCAALVHHGRLRFAWSALLFVLAVMIKPALATALLFLVIVSGARFALWTVGHTALLGLLSIALMGWDIQMEFVDKMLHGSGFTSDWYYSSALYTIVLQYMYAFDWDMPLMLRISGVIKLCVVASFAWVVIRTRRSLPAPRSAAHFHFLLALLFFLLVSQTVWEHYLSLLFIPLVFLLVPRRERAAGAGWMLPVFLASLPLQNLILVMALRNSFALESLAVLTPLMLLKTAPLWLAWIFLLWRHDWFIDMYRRDTVAAERPESVS